LQGIKDALSEAGLGIRPQHLQEGRWTIAEGRQLMAAILAHRARPTAVICGNAHLAVGAALEALDTNINLPEELSIVGYDNIEIMQEFPVPITTLRVRSGEVGGRAATYLISAIEGRTMDVARVCEVEIVQRASSGPHRRKAT
jgi:LacI family transcriptional regulator